MTDTMELFHVDTPPYTPPEPALSPGRWRTIRQHDRRVDWPDAGRCVPAEETDL